MGYKLVLEIANVPNENDILVFKNGAWYCVERGMNVEVLYTLLQEFKVDLKNNIKTVNELVEQLDALKSEIKLLKGEE